MKTTQIPLFQSVGEVTLQYTKNNIIILPDDKYLTFKKVFTPNTIGHRELMLA